MKSYKLPAITRPPWKIFVCLSLFLVHTQMTVQSVKSQSDDRGTGLIFVDEEDYRDIPLASTPLMGALPTSKDLSEWFPRPGDQGQQASCVGWAVAYGLKSYQESIERRRRPTSISHTFSPSYLYNQINAGSCGSGSQIYEALNLLRREGVAPLSEFPYNPSSCHRTPTQDDRTNARPYTIADWRRVNVNNEAEVKGQIANGFPIVIGMYIDDSFMYLSGNTVWQGPTGRSRGGHAMVVVGYDDNRKAYKVLNSWGQNWGDGGFGWISYGAFSSQVREAYTAQDVVIADPDHIEEVKPVEDFPPPTPAPAVTANLSAPIVLHNQMVSSPQGNVSGMVINVPGEIRNGLGSTAQMIIRFYFPDGSPLFANAAEGYFRDINGLAATGTPPGSVTAEYRTLQHISMSIPYYALNFQPSNGQNQYQISAQVTLYIDQFEKAKSPMANMVIRW